MEQSEIVRMRPSAKQGAESGLHAREAGGMGRDDGYITEIRDAAHRQRSTPLAHIWTVAGSGICGQAEAS